MNRARLDDECCSDLIHPSACQCRELIKVFHKEWTPTSKSSKLLVIMLLVRTRVDRYLSPISRAFNAHNA
eukprot:scaffold22736_cov111-Cylindrotheca_fusiformis.AAC.1